MFNQTKRRGWMVEKFRVQISAWRPAFLANLISSFPQSHGKISGIVL